MSDQTYPALRALLADPACNNKDPQIKDARALLEAHDGLVEMRNELLRDNADLRERLETTTSDDQALWRALTRALLQQTGDNDARWDRQIALHARSVEQAERQTAALESIVRLLDDRNARTAS